MDRQAWLEIRVQILEREVMVLKAKLRDAEERAFTAEVEPRRAARERHPSVIPNWRQT